MHIEKLMNLIFSVTLIFKHYFKNLKQDEKLYFYDNL